MVQTMMENVRMRTLFNASNHGMKRDLRDLRDLILNPRGSIYTIITICMRMH
jgi:hypothetical protein